MVTIRLSRSGAKKRPFYHITVADSRRESLGGVGGRYRPCHWFIYRVGKFLS